MALESPVVTVRLGGDLAGPHVVQRGRAVDDLAPRVFEHRAQFVVVQRRAAAHLDTAEGLGEDQDYSAFHVIDMKTLEQVAETRGWDCWKETP